MFIIVSLNACGSGGGGTDDSATPPVQTDERPTVAFQGLAANSVVSGTITITANATDDNGVSQVEFLADENSLGIDQSSPYELSWDTNLLGDGTHVVRVVATDSANQTGDSEVSIVIDNLMPSASVDSPIPSNPLSGIVTVTATCQNTDGSACELLKDGATVATAVAATVSYEWDTTDDSDGSYIFTARTSDLAGNIAADSASFEVLNENIECSNGWQKDWVLKGLRYWYLWNDLLPADINIANYASPEELVYEVTTTFGPKDSLGNPIDRWSFVRSLEADQQYFGEGKYEGFGFSWREEGGDMRIVGVFAGSPADAAGIERGQTVITLNNRSYADIVASEGIGAFFDDNRTVEFAVREIDGTTITTQVTKAIVTITPVTQWRTIPLEGGAPPVGYMEFRTFVSTANPVFDQVFADFVAAGVQDVIIDLRYNGGGLISTAELLGDYLGGFANDGLVFSQTEFNADRAAANNSTSYFSRRGNSIDITRFIVIASGSTASASELVTNSLIPYADVWIVGDNTYGKPVGQVGIAFCDKILRPTSFRTTNANGDGDYFEGLPVNCPAADILEIPVGDISDPNVVAALSISQTGSCPVATAPEGPQASSLMLEIRYPDVRGNTARELAGAF
jgi:C-terminal processing protease CtpA/Prc